MEEVHVKSAEDQESQKFFDIYTSTLPGTHGMEIFMRSFDQDGGQLTNQTCIPSSSTGGTTGSISMSMLPLPASSTTSLQELHSSLILQSLGLSATEEEDSSSSTGDRPHVCQVCRASYKTRTHLRRHMTVHLNDRPYPCSDCGKGFNRKEHLNKHIEAVHSGTKYKCQFCGKEISRKDHLSRHIKNMHPAFAGGLKDGAADDPSLMKIQLPCGPKQKAGLSFLTPTFGPSAIGQSSSNSLANKSHKNSKSNQQQNQSQQQPSQIILDQPLQQIILQGNLAVQSHGTAVTVATTSSSSSSGGQQKTNKLQTQNQNHNNQNGLVGLTNLSLTLGGQIREAPFANCSGKKIVLQVFTCTECNASYTNEKDLAAHVRTHKPQNFRCTECPRAYTRREKLTEHIRCFHQGQKFKCEYCGKELSRKDHVLRHVRSIHPEVLASRFTAQMQENACEVNAHDGSSTLLNGSNGSNAAALNEMGVLLRSVCHVCLKVFGTSYHLSRHIESCHNGDIRPYPCSACSKQFKRKDHLTKHLKSHCPSIRDIIPQNGHSRPKSVPNLTKLKMDCQNQNDDKKARSKRLKVESGSNPVGENVNENQDGDSKNQDRVLKQDDSEYHLAMINSFIAENVNVNVVVEEEELSSFLDNQSADTISESISEIETSDTSIETSPPSHNNQIITFPCGYCQKEFSSRDQLVDHIQEHSNEDITQDPTDPGHQEISSLELSSF